MKKSEMLEVLDRIVGYGEHHPTATAIVNAMEARGQAWDPEEMPFPESLALDGTRLVDADWKNVACPVIADARKNYCRDLDSTVAAERVLREAVRRWNAWPGLRADVHRWLAGAEPPEQLGRAILAILDGKGVE